MPSKQGSSKLALTDSFKEAKFIILRGPSGAGKSTVAKRLHKEAKNNVVLIEQDYYRVQMMRTDDAMTDEGKAMWTEMFVTDVLIALKHGYSVIVEGIFKPERYLPIFEKIWREHPTENYMFYFDVSFDETARRHMTRAKSADFNVDEMKEWYGAAQRSDLDWEVVIPEESSLDETVKTIQEATGI